MAALVEAATRILAIEGVAGLTTNRVAEVAGVGIGSLYQYFPSKEALAAAVIERRLEEDEAVFAEVLVRTDLSSRQRIEHVIDLACERQRDGASLMPQLLGMLGAVEREAVARQMIENATGRLHRVLLEDPSALRRDLQDPENLDVALFVLGRGLRWILNEAVVERPEFLDDPRFRRELCRLADGLFEPSKTS